ncbi:hypothetical protein ABZW67_01245 [Streptomyces rubiginosohelvolus]|uniref:effector-associated constant component EACC1 n=1 Tax=Streptomyces rubiginosohelvolus TaxID=67362 RepID=UPI0033B8E1BA
MEVSIKIASADAESELRSLFLWLKDDPYFRRNARVQMGSTRPAEGRMGGVFDSVELALSSTFDISNLVLAWCTWRATRPKRPEVTFERNGAKVTLSGHDPETVARLLDELDRT